MKSFILHGNIYWLDQQKCTTIYAAYYSDRISHIVAIKCTF